MTSPQFSIVTPVYAPPDDVLAEAIESVLAQTCGDWQLCLYDDASPTSTTRDIIDRFARHDRRIVATHGQRNLGIALATNAAIATATGEWIGFLDHDDLLVPDALERMAEAIRAHSMADVVYSDEDKLLPDGRYEFTFRKPPWSPERMRGQNYLCHFTVARRTLIDSVGGLREGFDGAQDFDLFLRLTERARGVAHVPAVLYHWRMIDGSTAMDNLAKPAAFEAGQRAVRDHCSRIGRPADVSIVDFNLGSYRVVPKQTRRAEVSIVIPSADALGRVGGVTRPFVLDAVEALCDVTRYDAFEIVIAEDEHRPLSTETRALLSERANVRIVSTSNRVFNFSRQLNAGVARCDGELVVAYNDDVIPTDPDWLSTLAAYLEEDDLGAIGPTLYFPDGLVQSAGHHHRGLPIADGRFLPDRYAGRSGKFSVAREVSGITGACLAVRRSRYLEVGGFNVSLPRSFNDVDFCLKLRAAGYRLVITPHVRLTHFEFGSRDRGVDDIEFIELLRRWRGDFVRDMFDPDGPDLGPQPYLDMVPPRSPGEHR